MNPLLQRLMQKAASLMHKGDLQGATAAIQEALAPQAPSTSTPRNDVAGHEPAGGDVIDVVAREIAEPPAPATARTAETPAAARAPAPPAAPRPEGRERFIAGTYSELAGRRAYKLYVPAQAGTRPLPLVVMLHGCTQDADDFARGTAMNDVAREQGFFVLYPEQSPQFNPQRCWNWFKHSNQERGRGEPALIAGMTREVMSEYEIDPERVYVAGLSAGGAMAAIMGDAYPDLYAAVGVHSGLATGAAKDLPSALGAMRSAPHPAAVEASGVPTIVFHGDADNTVHPGNGKHVIAASARVGTHVEQLQGVASGGRRYTRQMHRHEPGGPVVAEHWVIHGAPHAWSGGSKEGSYTDPQGPAASEEMVRFFTGHTRDAAAASTHSSSAA